MELVKYFASSRAALIRIITRNEIQLNTVQGIAARRLFTKVANCKVIRVDNAYNQIQVKPDYYK